MYHCRLGADGHLRKALGGAGPFAAQRYRGCGAQLDLHGLTDLKGNAHE